MNYVTDRKQIYNNTIVRVITKLSQNKTISTAKKLINELRQKNKKQRTYNY